MSAELPPVPVRGILDTNILILHHRVDPARLPTESSITAVTLAELSAGPAHVADTSTDYVPAEERARRLNVLQRAEATFDPIPFGIEAARAFGLVNAAVIAAGRKPRGRIADLMIASIAVAEGVPLYTTNPDDYKGLARLLTVVSVAFGAA